MSLLSFHSKNFSVEGKEGGNPMSTLALVLMVVLCLGPDLVAVQPVAADDTVHCASTQGTDSQDNGSSQCTATAAENSHAQSTARDESTASAAARLDSSAKSTATKHSSA